MFEAIGCDVEDARPDFTDADQIFEDIRAFSLTSDADLMREHRDQMKPEAIWNIDAGLKLSAEDVAPGDDQAGRTCSTRMSDFMERYDAFVCVVNQVPPSRSTSIGRTRSTACKWSTTSTG